MGAAFDELLELRGVEREEGARNDLTVAPVTEELGVRRRTAFHRLELAAIYAKLPDEERAAVDAGYSGPSLGWSVKASTRRVPGIKFQ